MSKLNINFNDKSFSIDESALADAKSSIKEHLSTALNGTGATIELGGVVYNIDASKLAAAENNFAAYLDTVGTDAPADDDQLEGSGAEYYTLAPTALSFRSTAPLDEFQEVQVNGVTVDPSNYTLEEGSTIVKLSIDYLKTLDVGNYDIAVKSNSKTASGDFVVKAPDLNEHSFYYNQPYSGYVDYFGSNVALFFRENSTLDVYVGTASTQCGYVVDGANIIIDAGELGELHAEVLSGGDSVIVHELGATCTIGNEAIVADDDFVYVYKEDLGGYEVTAIDKNKQSYKPIKLIVYNNKVRSVATHSFENNTNLTSFQIPNEFCEIWAIDEMAFYNCNNLTTVVLPDSITAIANQAFANCKNLTNFVLPPHIEQLGYNVFAGCSALTEMVIPYGRLKRIDSGAFSDCTALTNVFLAPNVTSIETDAFKGCTSLTTIEFFGTIDEWNAVTKFDGWNQNVPATHVTCLDGQVAL